MTGRSGPIAIVAHAAFPADPRIRRQVDALLAAGHEVDLFVLREQDQPRDATDAGLRIRRLPMRRLFNGFAGHLAEYLAFTALAAVELTRAHRRRHYALVQIATLPDFLVASSAALKLAGVPLLLDLHEDMPAFFDDRFAAPPLRPLRPLVGGVARASAAMADHVLTVHEPLRALAVARGLPPEKVTVVMNGPDEGLFDPSRHARRASMADGSLRLIHHSALQRIYGLEVAVESVARLRDRARLPVTLDVYGEGPHRPAIEEAIARWDVADRVTLHGRVPLEAVPALLAGADAGIVPSLPEPYLQLSLSTKLLELAAMGVPVIASDLATFRIHLDEHAVRYVPGGDPEPLADAIAELAADPAVAEVRAVEARRQVAAYGWSTQAPIYVEVVERLMTRAANRHA
jgi:glycosyltransferase involved in cell wall biosynthesis